MFIFKKIFDYFFGSPNYNIDQHWENQSKKRGLKSVMFWCEGYNPMADRVEKKEIVKCLGVIKRKKILDVGCGIGRLSKFLAYKGAFVTGIDIAPMVKRAKKENRHKNIDYKPISIFEIDLPPSSFDFVLSVATISPIANTDKKLLKIFGNISKTLKSGGLFLCIEPFHKHVLRRPCSKSVEEIIKLAGKFNLKLVYKGGILNFISRIAIENIKKMNIPILSRKFFLKKIFYAGESVLKIPFLQILLSDYKVITFKKLK